MVSFGCVNPTTYVVHLWCKLGSRLDTVLQLVRITSLFAVNGNTLCQYCFDVYLFLKRNLPVFVNSLCGPWETVGTLISPFLVRPEFLYSLLNFLLVSSEHFSFLSWNPCEFVKVNSQHFLF